MGCVACPAARSFGTAGSKLCGHGRHEFVVAANVREGVAGGRLRFGRIDLRANLRLVAAMSRLGNRRIPRMECMSGAPGRMDRRSLANDKGPPGDRDRNHHRPGFGFHDDGGVRRPSDVGVVVQPGIITLELPTPMANDEDVLIERFVATFDPPAERIDNPNPKDLEAIYARLPARFPRLYEKMVLRWRWGEVEFRHFALLANPSEAGFAGLLKSISYDRYLAEALFPAGFIPFAKATDAGGHDPICFNTKVRKGRRDCQIVRIHHEEILCNNRIKVQAVIASSFRELIKRALAP